MRRATAAIGLCAAALAGCGGGTLRPAPPRTAEQTTSSPASGVRTGPPDVVRGRPGGRPQPDRPARPGAHLRAQLGSNTVDVIDPTTFRIVGHFATGALPQHVTPSWDLKTLWVDNDEGNSLTPIDPRTGRPGRPVPVTDPYNLYFTPDGRYAIVVAERLRAARLPRRPHDATQAFPAGPVSGSGSPRLHRERALPSRFVRVRRPHGRGGREAPAVVRSIGLP